MLGRMESRMNRLLKVTSGIVVAVIAFPVHSIVAVGAVILLVADGWTLVAGAVVVGGILWVLARKFVPTLMRGIADHRRRWTKACFAAWKMWVEGQEGRAASRGLRDSLFDSAEDREVTRDE